MLDANIYYIGIGYNNPAAELFENRFLYGCYFCGQPQTTQRFRDFVFAIEIDAGLFSCDYRIPN